MPIAAAYPALPTLIKAPAIQPRPLERHEESGGATAAAAHPKGTRHWPIAAHDGEIGPWVVAMILSFLEEG